MLILRVRYRWRLCRVIVSGLWTLSRRAVDDRPLSSLRSNVRRSERLQHFHGSPNPERLLFGNMPSDRSHDCQGYAVAPHNSAVVC